MGKSTLDRYADPFALAMISGRATGVHPTVVVPVSWTPLATDWNVVRVRICEA